MTKVRRFAMLSMVLVVVTVLALGTWFSPQAVQAAQPSVTGTWTITSSMNVAHNYHTATLLKNGQVLVAGGWNGGATAELYNPVTGKWTLTGSMHFMLSDGTKDFLIVHFMKSRGEHKSATS